jgi:hypothetical protein
MPSRGRRAQALKNQACGLLEPGWFAWVNAKNRTIMIILRVDMNEMMRKWCPVVAVLVLLSCAARQEVPPGVLNRDEMVKMLTEILITEDKVSKLGIASDSAYEVSDLFRARIFEKADMTDSLFRRSMNYYIEHPKEMQQIYTTLVDSLNLREQRASVAAEKK